MKQNHDNKLAKLGSSLLQLLSDDPVTVQSEVEFDPLTSFSGNLKYCCKVTYVTVPVLITVQNTGHVTSFYQSQHRTWVM